MDSNKPNKIIRQRSSSIANIDHLVKNSTDIVKFSDPEDCNCHDKVSRQSLLYLSKNPDIILTRDSHFANIQNNQAYRQAVPDESNNSNVCSSDGMDTTHSQISSIFSSARSSMIRVG